LVTVTLIVPALPEGAVAVIEVAELMVKVALVEPKETEVALVNPVPVMTTKLPPATGPAEGLTTVTLGGVTYVNPSDALVAEVPPATVTVTSTVPAAWAGEVTEQLVVVEQLTPVPAVAPKLTVVAPMTNPVPLTVTAVLPVIGPVEGLTAVTVGTVS
jgi:hypothetical protein